MSRDEERRPLLIFAFTVLVALTFCSLVVGQGWLPVSRTAGLIVMIGISCAKAAVVVLVFMHFYWEASWKYLLTFPAAIMSIFLASALVPDILYRGDHYSDHRKNFAAGADELKADSSDHSETESNNK